MPLHEHLQRQRRRVEAALDRIAPKETDPPEAIHKAMRYSLFAGGKRLRPILFLEAANTVGGAVAGMEEAAASLELIHTYSLIHDDLPALDNDELRRGHPTNHKVFGEALAILAGDALLTLAFRILAQLPADAAIRVRLIEELSTAAGTVEGMIAGQVRDLEGERAEPTAERLESIHRAKTGALIRASVRMGGIYAGADSGQLTALTCFGEHIGLAFQIIDDVLDVEQPSEALGKTAGKDAAQKKITFPAVYGLDQSRRLADIELEKAHAALQPFGDRARWLHEIAELIARRNA